MLRHSYPLVSVYVFLKRVVCLFQTKGGRLGMLAGNFFLHISVEFKRYRRISENDMPDSLFGDNLEDNGDNGKSDESRLLVRS